MAFSIPSNLVLLSSQTASSSASISFTNEITSDFTSYYVILRDIVAATNNQAVLLTFSTDNGSTYLSSNYQYAIQYAESGNTNTHAQSTGASSITLTPPLSSTTSQAYSGNVNLYGFAQGTLPPMLYGFGANQDNATSYLFSSVVTAMNTGTTAINAIKFAMASGNITSGTITLYGMVDS